MARRRFHRANTLLVTLFVWMSGVADVHAEHHANLTLNEVVQKMQAAQSRIVNLEFSFVEKSQGPAGADSTVAGKVLFSRPHRLRVDQRTPEKQTLISDGTHFWLYTPSAQQQLTGLWKPWIAQTGFPAPLLSFVGDFPATEWAERYTILFTGYEDHLYGILFKPKNKEDASVQLWISDESFLPERGESTRGALKHRVTFSGMQTPATVDQNRFNTAVPAGTAVVPVGS